MSLLILNRLQQAAEQNLADIEAMKASGIKVVGTYCLYSPIEVLVAAGAVTLPLCGTRNDPIAAAEEVLPRNLCPLIKSSYGFAATDTCPYFRLSDIIVADTTCDGKKKMFELLARYRPVYVLQLPQNQDPQTALPFWVGEVGRFKVFVEKTTGTQISPEMLREAIRQVNRERRAYQELMDLGKLKPPPLSGIELLNIKQKIGFLADRESRVTLLQEAVQEVRKRTDTAGPSPEREGPRILLTGVPVGFGSEKVVRLIEEAGARVVCFETCGGYKRVQPVDEAKEPLTAIAERYLSTPCSVMSPNNGRLALLDRLISEFAVDGVVDLTWQACHTYNVEAYTIGKFATEKRGLPFLHLETDYSASDTEQLRVRIEAFLEIMTSR
jgi:benzoyl-CoA reductase/2-hydroxyglutaryl-CoA dehydratase subunit BcrC/BadD/HgdB